MCVCLRLRGPQTRFSERLRLRNNLRHSDSYTHIQTWKLCSKITVLSTDHWAAWLEWLGALLKGTPVVLMREGQALHFPHSLTLALQGIEPQALATLFTKTQPLYFYRLPLCLWWRFHSWIHDTMAPCTIKEEDDEEHCRHTWLAVWGRSWPFSAR